MGVFSYLQRLFARKTGSQQEGDRTEVANAVSYEIPNRPQISVRLRQVTFCDGDLNDEQQQGIEELLKQFRNQPAIVGSNQWFVDLELLCVRAQFDRSITIPRGQMVQIGRRQESPDLLPSGTEQFQVRQRSVSRRHAQVRLDLDGLLWLTDCNSTFGSRIFRRLTPRSEHRDVIDLARGQQARLHNGDYLHLGPKGGRNESVLISVEDPDG